MTKPKIPMRCVKTKKYFVKIGDMIPRKTISGILQTKMNQRGDPIKMNFNNFQKRK